MAGQQAPAELLAAAVPDAAHDNDPLVERYLEHVRVEKRLAQRTVELYSLDLLKLQTNCR